MIGNLLRRVAKAAAGAAIDFVFERFTGKKATTSEGTRDLRPGVERLEPSGARVEPVRPEARGSARDERSFEQRRRGGPVTGEAPSKIHGPRHTGGGKRRGREVSFDGDDDPLAFELPIMDYDELPPGEIETRVRALDRSDVRAILAYETSNKNRKSIVDALRRRLAA